MNHVYKVIWSKAKHCFVVVSELAKRDGKVATGGISKAAVMAALVLTMGSGLAAPQVVDANYTNGGTENGIYYNYGFVTDPTVGAANTHDGIAIGASSTGTATAGTVSIAIGDNAVASGETAQTAGQTAGYDPDGHNNTGNHGQAIAIGNNSTAKGVQATALGDDSHADNFGAVALGNNTWATEWDTLALGSASHADGVRSTAIGTYAHSEGDNSTAIGLDSWANGSHSIVIGASQAAGTSDPNLMARADGNYSLAIGYSAKVYNATAGTNMDGSIAIGEKASADDEGQLVLGQNATATGKYATAIGRSSMAQGESSLAIGDSTKANEKQSTAIGYGATTNAEQSTAIGASAVADKTGDVALGNSSHATGPEAVAIGLSATASKEGAISMGNEAGASALSALALGDGAQASNANSVALGSGSATSNTHTGDSATFYTLNNKATVAYSATKKTNSVSIGTVNGERQLQNVAAGDVTSTSTDAVNGSQLYQLTKGLETEGLTIAGDTNTTGTTVALGNKISVVGNGGTTTTGYSSTNVMTTEAADGSGAKVQILMSDTPAFTSVKTGDTVLDTQGMTVTGGPTITKTTVDVAGNKITKVAKGDVTSTSLDAVNGSQLKSFTDAAKTKVAPGKNTTIVGTTNTDGSMTYTVDLASTIVVGDDHPVKINGTAGTITGLTNTDWKNGNPTGYSADRAASEGELSGVQTEVTNVNTKVDAGWKATAEGTSVKTVTPTDNTLNFKGDSKNITVANDNGSVKVSMSDTPSFTSTTIGDTVKISKTGIDNGGQKITNVKDGDISDTSTDAINGSQLNKVETDLTNKGLTFGANSGAAVTKKLGGTISVLGSVTKAGHSYSTDNLTTEVSTDGNIIVKMDDSISAASVQVGKDGKDGFIGVAGKAGKDGVTITAKDGDNGAEGQIGLTGAAGKDGKNATADIITVNGKVGVDGTDGNNGKDGMDRIDYTDHNKITHEVATLDDGMKYGGDTGKTIAMKLNGQVNVQGGVTDETKLSDSNNVGIVSDGTDTLKVKLAKDLTGLTSVTTGDTTVNTNGMTIKNGPTITKTVVDAAGNKVTNVKDGDINKDSKDAVNGSQLYTAEQDLTNKGLNFGANSGDTVTNKLGSTVNIKGAGTKADVNYSGDNIKTVVGQATDGTTTINVLMDKDITGSSVVVGAAGKDGAPGTEGRIGVKGADGKEAVVISAHDGGNGTEGHIGLTGLPGKDGKDAKADIIVRDGDPGVNGKDGEQMTRVVYTDKGGTEHQIATLDDGLKFKGDGEETIAKKLNETMSIKGGADSTNLSDNNIGVVVKDGTLNVKLAKDLTGLTSVTTGDTTVNTNGMTIKNGPTITKTVVDAAGNKVTNVKDGDVNKDSKDAVNGSQLYNATKGLTDEGLKFGANSGTTVTNKLGSTVNVVGEGTKADTEYSGTNLKTKVSQAADGTTSIEVMMDNNLTGNSVTVGGAGTDGAPGVNGSIGVKGADGKDGVNAYAINGTNGTEGHIGLTGLAGKDGKNATADIVVKNGAVGVDGTDGSNGKDGMDRIDYTDHKGKAHDVATLDDGMMYGGDMGDAIALKLNHQLNVKGGVTDQTMLTDNNIGVVSDGTGTLNVKLSKELKGLTSTTYVDGDGQLGTTINNKGVTIENGDHDVSLTKTGLDNGGNTISNVAQGVKGTDAVNVDQLKEAAAAATTKVEGGTNTEVTSVTNGDGSTTYKVDLKPTVTLGTDPDKQVKLDGTNGTIKAGKVTVDGTAGTVTGLTNTTWVPGETNPVSGRAATEDQLKSVSDVAYTASKQHTTIDNKDGNITIEQGTNKDGGLNYTVGLTDNISVGGKTGKDGSIGVKGHDGTNGVNIYTKDGTDAAGGNTGTEGHIGLTGPKGADGTNVTADIHVMNGQAGVNGKDGDTMTRVVYEDKDGTTHSEATLDDGMKYKGDTGSAAVKLDKNVSIVGETAQGTSLTTGNIGVEASQDGDNAKLVVKLADNLTGIKNITTENMNATTVKAETVNATTVNATTFKAGDTVTINQDGINAGGTKITNVTNGSISANSQDAVNGSQLYQTDMAVTNLGNSINDLDNRVDKVGAGAAALAALHPLDFDPDEKWDFAAGYGHYKGANAGAIGAYYRPNEDTMVSLGGSIGNGENMINAGVSFKLGQGNHVSTSRVAMAKEIKDLRKEVEDLRSMLVGVSQGQRLDMTQMKLFPDIPANHWAYDAIKVLAGNGIVEGYPSGNFDGDRMMTRYEFAMIVYRAMQKGANVNSKLLKEFEPELERIRVDTVAKDKDGNPTIQRVRVIPGRG